MYDHVRDVIADFADAFQEEHKASTRSYEDKPLRLFDDQINMFLIFFIDAAIKDGCSRQYLMERGIMAAEDALVAGRIITDGLNQAAGKALIKAATEQAHHRMASKRPKSDAA